MTGYIVEPTFNDAVQEGVHVQSAPVQAHHRKTSGIGVAVRPGKRVQ